MPRKIIHKSGIQIMETRILTSIYKSKKILNMYLYVEHEQGMDRVPESLLKQFGQPVFVMHLKLTPDRRLARAEAPEVMQALKEQGYYLQLPPSPFD